MHVFLNCTIFLFRKMVDFRKMPNEREMLDTENGKTPTPEIVFSTMSVFKNRKY